MKANPFEQRDLEQLEKINQNVRKMYKYAQ